MGNLYVVDYDHHRIEKFASDGTFVTKWGSEGSAPGQFIFETSVAADGSGNIFVADSWNNRVEKFTSDGRFLLELGTPGTGVAFVDPSSVAVDPSGNLYVNDFIDRSGRIQKLSCP